MKKLIFALLTFLLITANLQAQEKIANDSTRIYPENFFPARPVTPQKKAKKVKPPTVNTAPQESVVAEALTWKTGGSGRLGFAMNNYKNWSAGALNSTTIDGNIDLFANYQKGNFTWITTAKFGIGLVGSSAFVVEGSDSTRFWRKSLDILAVGSDLGCKFNDKLALTLPITFATQFTPTLQFRPDNPALTANVSALNPSEANSIVSRFFSPAYLAASTGIKWTPVSMDNKVIEFSTEILAQSKTTIIGNTDIARIYSLSPDAEIVGDNAIGIYGNIIDKTTNEVQTIRPEFGAAANFAFAYKGIKNVVFNSRLGLFKNFIENKFNGISDPQNTSLTMDINWLNKIDFNVPITFWGKTFNFTTTFEHQLVKDADITIYNRDGSKSEDNDVQNRFFFGAGLTYQFGYKQ